MTATVAEAPTQPRTADAPAAVAHNAIVPALDGLRGLAVSLAVFFHLRPDLLPGGWLAMSMFFPLSGFLITRLLLTEWGRTDTISLKQFWVRRARRLLPALYALLLVLAIVLVTHGLWDAGGRGATLSSLLYVNNWWQLGHAADYWARFSGTPSPFEHLWSLGVEEQFYLVWPLLVFAAVRWSRRPLRAVGILAATIMVIGVAYGLAIGHLAGGSMTDQYYNTVVRAAELLAGSALAVWMVARPATATSARVRHTLDVAAILALSITLLANLKLDDYGEWFMNIGGMFITGVGSVIVIASAMRGGHVTKLLDLRVLQWMGTRCYSVYLWHWPIIVFVNSESTNLTGWALFVLRVGIMLAAVVLSFWLVEEPFRRWMRPRDAWARAQRAVPAVAGARA